MVVLAVDPAGKSRPVGDFLKYKMFRRPAWNPFHGGRRRETDDPLL
jgi:hypothetical protein